MAKNFNSAVRYTMKTGRLGLHIIAGTAVFLCNVLIPVRVFTQTYFRECAFPIALPDTMPPTLSLMKAMDGFTVHYELEGPNATTEQYVDSIRADLAYSLEYYVSNGWDDCPLLQQAPINVYVVGPSYDKLQGRDGVAISLDLIGSGPGRTSAIYLTTTPTPSIFDPWARLRSLCAHELHHCYQIAYNLMPDQESWFNENTSSWVVRLRRGQRCIHFRPTVGTA